MKTKLIKRSEIIKLLFHLIMVGVFTMLANAPRVYALEKAVEVVKDTYINPEEDYSHANDLIVKVASVSADSRTYAYLQTESNIIPSDATVNNAYLKLFVTKLSGSSCNIFVERMTQTWDEGIKYTSGIGYSNPGSTEATVTIDGDGFYNFGVTDLFKKWQNNTYANYGVVLYTNDNCTIEIASRQNGVNERVPKLVVDYTPASTPTSAPSPTTSPTITPKKSPTPKISPTPLLSPTQEPTAKPTPITSISLTPTPVKTNANFSFDRKMQAGLVLVVGMIILSTVGGLLMVKWNKKTADPETANTEVIEEPQQPRNEP